MTSEPMSDERMRELHDRVSAMSEEERRDLDGIAYALEQHIEKHRVRKQGHVVPNRVAALAAVDAMHAWESAGWNRE